MTGRAVRDLRQRLSLTQEDFAHELGVTVSTVNRWENGRLVPSRLARKALQFLAVRRGHPSHQFEEKP